MPLILWSESQEIIKWNRIYKKKHKLKSYSSPKVDSNSPTNTLLIIIHNNHLDITTASNSSAMTRKASSVFAFLSVLLFIQNCNAYEFKVGGPKGSWTVPSDPNASMYNQWAEKNRFQIGDTLLFVYDSSKDSVLRVTKEDYTSCKTASPLEKFTDGHTVVKFDQSGPHYFISGVSDNCLKNEKLHVIVLADRSKKYNGPTASPPSPSAKVPSPTASPPSPSAKVPSPAAAPSGEVSPSDSVPSEESSHSKNSATFVVGSGVGTIAALFCSWIVSAI